jgi:hypothetical protein
MSIKDQTDTKFTSIHKKYVIFQSTKQRSKGVTKVIKKVFFPGYSHRKLTGNYVRGLKPSKARSNGKKIDSELSECVGVEPIFPNNLLPETRHLLSYISRSGYFIESAQTPVGFAPWRLFTRIDLVLRPKNTNTNPDHRVAVEVKSGYANRKCSIKGKRSRFFNPPIEMSPLGLHKVQTLIGAELLRKCKPELPVKKMLVYISKDGVDVIKKIDIELTSIVTDALVRSSNKPS